MDLIRTHRAPLKLADVVGFYHDGRTLEGVISNIDRGTHTTWYKVQVTGTPNESNWVKHGDTYYFSADRAARELTPKRSATMGA